MPLTAFEGASLQPHEFKEQLRRVFNIHLSPRELGALMDLFDKDKDGTIACNEFLIMFFKTGNSKKQEPGARHTELGSLLSCFVAVRAV